MARNRQGLRLGRHSVDRGRRCSERLWFARRYDDGGWLWLLMHGLNNLLHRSGCGRGWRYRRWGKRFGQLLGCRERALVCQPDSRKSARRRFLFFL
jgi:hypothetical protein